MKTFKHVLLASAVALALGSTAVHAGTISSLLHNGSNQASDENREYLINRGGGATTVDVGDSLRGFIGINTLNAGGANVGGITANNEFTAVFQALVTSVTNLGGNSFFYTFAPDPAFAADICGGVGAPCSSTGLPVPGAGAMAVLFEGVVHNFGLDGPGTPEGKGASAMDGSWFWTLGFDGGPGEGWTALTAPGLGNDIANAATFSVGTIGGLVNAGLSCLGSGAGAPTCAEVFPLTPGAFGPVDFAMGGSLRGIADITTSFQAASDTTVAFNLNLVPEPGTLALLGTALFGLGALGYRRKT